MTEAKASNDLARLLYVELGDKRPPSTGKCEWLKLVLVTDSAFANLVDKYSQGAWAIFLFASNARESVGGYGYLIVPGSRRSTRVCKSTWGAELLALVQYLSSCI